MTSASRRRRHRHRRGTDRGGAVLPRPAPARPLSRLRPGWAVLGQALVFSVVHVDPLRGAGNVSVVVSTATLGLVFGWSAVRYGRLGPGMVAHAIQNSAATALVLLTE